MRTNPSSCRTKSRNTCKGVARNRPSTVCIIFSSQLYGMGLGYKNSVPVDCAQILFMSMRCNRVQVQRLQATVKRASCPQGVSNLNVYMQEYNIEMRRMHLCVQVVGRYESVHIKCQGCRETQQVHNPTSNPSTLIRSAICSSTYEDVVFVWKSLSARDTTWYGCDVNLHPARIRTRSGTNPEGFEDLERFRRRK